MIHSGWFGHPPFQVLKSVSLANYISLVCCGNAVLNDSFRVFHRWERINVSNKSKQNPAKIMMVPTIGHALILHPVRYCNVAPPIPPEAINILVVLSVMPGISTFA
ncbi:hypothetical protein D3C74_448560 [compost metagenome]